MDTITIAAAGQSQVIIHQFGAHVTSWKNATGREMIYTSPSAIYDGKKAIRGGIPVCFPQFAKKGPLKQHGFARNMKWSVDTGFKPEDGASARLILTDTEETRNSEWPHSFELALTVTLASDGNSMTVAADVSNKNTNGMAFTFTMALHSYFTCNAESTVLQDFDRLSYEDNTETIEPPERKRQTGTIAFGKEVDRIYFDAPDSITLQQANLSIHKVNMPDAVVWNPYVDKAAALSDMPDDGWKHFICIEPARIASPATVTPRDSWTCSLRLMSIV